MEIGSNYQDNNRIPKYRHFAQDTNNSSYKRENGYSSINNNISTSLSSYEKNNNEKNFFKMKLNRENNIINTSSRGTRRSRSKSPCQCGCHSNEECVYVPEIHCIPVFDHGQSFTQMNSSLITKNEEINKKNDELFNEIIFLKRNLRRVENELTRTKAEKDASDFYIKELEKELLKLNTESISHFDNNNNNILNDSKRRLVNSVKMRDYGRYHDMLNRSFEVLDSVSNKINDPKGKTKGGINYYYNRNQDYDNVIDSQKKWIDNLPQSVMKNNDNYTESAPLNTNQYDNNLYNDYNNNNSKRNNNLPNNFNNINDENSNTKRIPSKLNLDSNSYSNQMTEKTKSIFNNNPYDNNKKNNNIIPMPYPKKINQNNNINNNSNMNNQNNQREPNMNNNNKKNKANREDDKDDENNENKNPQYNKLNERILITDSEGNPIFIDGNRLLGMEIIPIIGENGKEEMDDNGNIIFLGPDGQPKTQDDLEPIILDNDKPLVNEENRPFLGINGVAMINKYGNPIIGPGELYDSNNQVVHGELGILPVDNQGNLIKINNNNEEPILNDNDNNNDYNTNEKNNDNDNNDYNDNDDDNNPKKNNKKQHNNIPNYDNNNDVNEAELKPLIGSDGKPVTDKNNNPIILDKNNKPIRGTGITVLLDKSGMPILNTLGEPILINKEGEPINVIDEDDDNPIMNNKRNNSHKNKPNKNNRKKNKIEKFNDINNNKETGKFNNNPFINENKSKKNNYVYPKPNPNYQRKNNYKPIINTKNNERNNDNLYFSNTCFACDVGCGVSRSGYSPMTYSPYDNTIKRRDNTPLKDDVDYYEYISK